MADRLEFYDGSQFDDERDSTQINDSVNGGTTSSPTRDPNPTIPPPDPDVPPYDPSSIVVNVNGSTSDLQVTAGDDVVIQNSPGSFQISFRSILENGVRVRASKTGFTSPYYYVISTYWIDERRKLTDEPSDGLQFDDGRQVDINGDVERTDEISFKSPGILVEKFDQIGNRVNTDRLQNDTLQQVIDIFFEMEAVIEPARPLRASLGILSITEDDRIVGTPNERNDIFSISLFNDELDIDRFEEGAFISQFPNKNEDVIINIENPNFEVVEFRIYKSTGGRDWEQIQLIDTITDQSELQITVNDELVVEVEYRLAKIAVPKDQKPEVIVGDDFTYNVDNEDPPSFEIELVRGDGVRVQVASRSFEVDINQETGLGLVELDRADFNGIGQYRIFVIPFDDLGDGILEEIIINVVQDPVKRISQFTEINYPSIIEGADYDGYDTDFELSWNAIQTEVVDVYIGEDHVPYGEFAPNEAITLNVNQLINNFGLEVGDDELSFTFPIRLVPKLGGEAGIEEEFEIQFNKSRIQLPTDLVRDNIENALLDALDMDLLDINTSKLLTHIVNIEGLDFNVISNWERDDVTFTEFVTDPQTGNELPKDGVVNTSLVLKLFEPLPTSVQPNTQLWISKLKAVPYIDRVVIREDGQDTCIKLAPANFNISPMKGNMGYEMFDDIIGSGSAVSSQQLINEFVGRIGIDTEKLDIIYKETDEYQFENFVHFGSAEEQVLNFFYKIELLETYNERIDDIQDEIDSGSLDVTGKREVKRIETRRQTLISGLNGFEWFLYKKDFPRDSGNLELTNSSVVQSWLGIIKEQATEFDRNNENSLTNENNIPRHILRDENNEEFLLFLEMVGHHFDIIWAYTNEITSKNKVEHKKNTGIIDNHVYHMLESFGWDVDSSIATQQLWQTAFGELGGDNATGQLISQNTPGTEYQNQIWRRILNNLPYLLKHKGTKRSVQAILAAYGIPQSMLTIMEFGGTRDDEVSVTQFTFEDRSVSLKTEESEYAEVIWDEYNDTHPDAVELRVKPFGKQEYTIVNNTTDWSLTVTPTLTGSFATFEFEILSNGSPTSSVSDSFPFYNDEYSQILINRATEGGDEIYTVDVAQGFQERIRAHVSASLIVPTGSTSWASGSELEIGNGYVGNIDEVRLWAQPLAEDRFFNHTLSPDSIDGNELFSYRDDLLVRFDFERPKNRGVDVSIKNVAPNIDYAESGSAVGFVSGSSYPWQHEVYERTVTANVPSIGFTYGNKTRIEDVELISDLSHKSRATKQSFDRAATDTNQLGLFFSPIKEVNLDIVKSFGNFRIDDYIGDPSYEFKENYPSLDKLRHEYFANLNLNIYEYIQLVRFIDKSLFEMLENVLPARAQTSKGLLIEPHLFNRSKVQWKRPEANDNVKNTEINVLDTILEEADDLSLDAILDAVDEAEFIATDLSYEGLINDIIEEELDFDFKNLIGEIHPIEDEDQSGQYLTYFADILAEIGVADVTAVNVFDVITQAGLGGEENPSIGGFGLYAQDGFTEKVTFENGELQRERVYVELVTECRTIQVGVDANGDPVFEERCDEKLNFQPADEVNPTPGAVPVDGYLPGHSRNTSDRSTGLNRSYHEGSKNTSETTLDGSPAVETFTTNPNTLRVSDQGRGSGEPILEVD